MWSVERQELGGGEITPGVGNRKESSELGNQNTTFAAWSFFFPFFTFFFFLSYKDIREQNTYICFCSKATFPFLQGLF